MQKLCAYGRFIIDHQDAPLITHVYPLSNTLVACGQQAWRGRGLVRLANKRNRDRGALALF